MCGIVGAIAERQVLDILLEGLRRLEYRGYDSAGVAIASGNELQVRKEQGKVSQLEQLLKEQPANGQLGIAHTRWATHGKPSQVNSHPHTSGNLAVVHNGIIENHSELKAQLQSAGYEFCSQTDTEVIAHLLHKTLKTESDLLTAVRKTVAECEGAYALAVLNADKPDELVVARSGSPLVIGVGIGENFIASDPLALRQVTDRYIYLEEGDTARLTQTQIQVVDDAGKEVERPIVQLTDADHTSDKGEYRHFMLKEIYEQPKVIKQTLQGRLGQEKILENAFGVDADAIFDQVEQVHIVACGTSYHAGMVAKYWLEDWANIPCTVEVASEYRYRKVFVPSNVLFVTISQSGETADTLAALRKAKASGYIAATTICNVPNSSLVRESDLSLMTEAGPEIGVASTKAFTTQLVALQLLSIALGRRHGLTAQREAELVKALHKLPQLCEQVLSLDTSIEKISEDFIDKNHALFLGRGVQFPVALEGALKLKEISYIHAEAYPAGELKHGPLALVDSDMPIVAVAPKDDLLDKLKSNLEEVQARGGELVVFTVSETGFTESEQCKVIHLPQVPESLAPLVYTLPLQLLSYHVAVLKGTDVDQPRNLAKSVTVE